MSKVIEFPRQRVRTAVAAKDALHTPVSAAEWTGPWWPLEVGLRFWGHWLAAWSGLIRGADPRLAEAPGSAGRAPVDGRRPRGSVASRT
jgi:hypothetical protein